MMVYHLHLPRTSGVFLRNVLNLKNSVAGHSFPININDFKNVEYAMGHYGTYPIQFSSLTFSILRNPVERTISYLKYIKHNFYQSININDLVLLYLENKTLKESISNLSNKFLTGSVNFSMYNKYIKDQRIIVENGWFCEDYKQNSKNSIEQINKDNIQILYFEDPELYNKISKIYNIEIIGERLNFSYNYSISKELIDEIVKINEIDLDIYEHFKK